MAYDDMPMDVVYVRFEHMGKGYSRAFVGEDRNGSYILAMESLCLVDVGTLEGESVRLFKSRSRE